MGGRSPPPQPPGHSGSIPPVNDCTTILHSPPLVTNPEVFALLSQKAAPSVKAVKANCGFSTTRGSTPPPLYRKRRKSFTTFTTFTSFTVPLLLGRGTLLLTDLCTEG